MENELDNFLNGANDVQDDSVFDARNDDPFQGFLGDQQQADPEEGEEDGEGGTKPPKKLPFHEDPKVQRYVARQIRQALEAQGNNVQQPQQVQSQDKVALKEKAVDAYTRLIGNDTPEKVSMVNELSDILVQFGQQAAEDARQGLAAQQREAERQEQESLDELQEGLDDIEDTYNVDLSSPQAKKLRNEFLDFLEKVSPKKNGEIIAYADPVTTFEMFQNLKKRTQQPSRNRTLSSRSMQRSAPVAQKPAAGGTWADVDNMIESLG